MKIKTQDRVKIMYESAGNPMEEIGYIFNTFNTKQRDLIVNLLLEEKENIEPFVEQNMWVQERVQIIDDILYKITN